jgi:ribonuclease HII
MKQHKDIDLINGPSFEIEAGLFAQGHRYIAGVDEAGRGALAGPLAVALTIYDTSLFSIPLDEELTHINDSKKISPKRREILRQIIQKRTLAVVYQEISVEDVDRYNINGATYKGVRQLIDKSPVTPDCIIMDGNFSFDFEIPFIPVIKGDNLSVSIASASIEAKVVRDQTMNELEQLFPGYGLSVHKGYGTQIHRDAIERIGPSVIHRKSYEPVKSIIEQRIAKKQS